LLVQRDQPWLVRDLAVDLIHHSLDGKLGRGRCDGVALIVVDLQMRSTLDELLTETSRYDENGVAVSILQRLLLLTAAAAEDLERV